MQGVLKPRGCSAHCKGGDSASCRSHQHLPGTGTHSSLGNYARDFNRMWIHGDVSAVPSHSSPAKASKFHLLCKAHAPTNHAATGRLERCNLEISNYLELRQLVAGRGATYIAPSRQNSLEESWLQSALISTACDAAPCVLALDISGCHKSYRQVERCSMIAPQITSKAPPFRNWKLGPQAGKKSSDPGSIDADRSPA